MDTRVVNSAIYIEPPTRDENFRLRHYFMPIDKFACGDSLSQNEVPELDLRDASDWTACYERVRREENNSEEYKAYGCLLNSMSNCSFSKAERRCKIINTSSGSSSNQSEDTLSHDEDHRPRHPVSKFSKSNSERRPRPESFFPRRQLSYEDWKRSKDSEILKKKKPKQDLLQEKEEADRLARIQNEKERREKINFLKWMKQKELEKCAEKKKVFKDEMKIQKMLDELNEVSDAMKKIAIKQWGKKKKIEKEVEEKKAKMEQEKKEQEKKQRLEESLRAFQQWTKRSKHITKAPTQGLLPHQMAKPTYVNPKPWQDIVNTGVKLKS